MPRYDRSLMLAIINSGGRVIHNGRMLNTVGDVPSQLELNALEEAQDDALPGAATNAISVQENPVLADAPNLNDVLMWDGEAWSPTPIPEQEASGGGDFTKLAEFICSGSNNPSFDLTTAEVLEYRDLEIRFRARSAVSDYAASLVGVHMNGV